MTSLLKSLPLFAKAIAAVIAPIIVSLLAWVASNVTDFDVPTAGAVETAVVSVITGIAVYLTRNQTPDGGN